MANHPQSEATRLYNVGEVREQAKQSILKGPVTVDYPLDAGRFAYLVPATGAVEVNGVAVKTRDGAAIRDEEVLRITALETSEIVLVDAA